MNNDPGMKTNDPIDDAVRDAYRSMTPEQPPPDLDRLIQAEARAAVGNWRPRWLVPAALAATGLLSVALLMRMAMGPAPLGPADGTVDSPSARNDDRAAPAAALLKQEAETTPSDIGTQTGGRAGGSMPDQAGAERPAGAGAPNPPALSDTRQQLPGPAPTGSPASLETATPAEVPAAAPAPRGSGSEQTAAGTTADGCTASQRQDPALWITCMQTLKARHEDSLAAELAAWRASYPNRPLPAELTDPD